MNAARRTAAVAAVALSVTLVPAQRAPTMLPQGVYYSQALCQRGGRDWDDDLAVIGPWLVREQRPDVRGRQGDGVGPVYGTATLVIWQLPYALVPIHQR